MGLGAQRPAHELRDPRVRLLQGRELELELGERHLAPAPVRQQQDHADGRRLALVLRGLVLVAGLLRGRAPGLALEGDDEGLGVDIYDAQPSSIRYGVRSTQGVCRRVDRKEEEHVTQAGPHVALRYWSGRPLPNHRLAVAWATKAAAAAIQAASGICEAARLFRDAQCYALVAGEGYVVAQHPCPTLYRRAGRQCRQSLVLPPLDGRCHLATN
mmetsp:Transcript_16168/g.47151  ORF Transcript_16168/g.47151 Transcript_16168/m.47151 type:complete len:214 (+) Transcript_16168:59-700(+)